MRWPRRAWAALAMCGAAIPFVQGLAGMGVFYIRDLGLVFWGRHVWLRRELFSGHFPLWDPYVGGGQSAAADALRQLFLPPAFIPRLIGSDVFSFNLWVASPFPLAALGAWLFLAGRFTLPAATLGALAFAVSGPVVATANFPNMSWAVAAIPWVLWAVDRAAAEPTRRRVAALAVAVAMQAAAGEPVTMAATLATAGAFAIIVNGPAWRTNRVRSARVAWLAAGVAIGVCLAAIQLAPLYRAAVLSERATSGPADFWSLHPLALSETISLHLLGDHFTAASLQETPWLPPLNSGREPFFFSIYFGVPLLVLAAAGLVSSRPVRWTWFWASIGAISVVSACGAHTPIYPFLRDHLPLLKSFRFPAKYMVMTSLAVAALAAAGWDVLADRAQPAAVRWRARVGGLSLSLTIAGIAALIAAACIYAPHWAAFRLLALAQAVHAPDAPLAAEFLFLALPSAASLVLLLSVVTAAVIWWSGQDGREASAARTVLFAGIVIDLMVRAAGLNPVMNPAYVGEPEWVAPLKADPDARFYVGGKHVGGFDRKDFEGSATFSYRPALTRAENYAAAIAEVNFAPSAWRTRELLTTDVAALWPREFELMTRRFLTAPPDERDRLLDRSAVRYRVLPDRLAAGHAPLAPLALMQEAHLFDWGEAVAPRVSVVGASKIVASMQDGVDALFEDGWDHRATAIIEHETAAAGDSRPPEPPRAQVTSDTANRVVVNAGVAAGGGYLVMLDSYTDDWRAFVDGRPAEMTRANGLFRAVRLNPGRHEIEFVYRPRALLAGAIVSAAALLLVLGLIAWPAPRKDALT